MSDTPEIPLGVQAWALGDITASLVSRLDTDQLATEFGPAALSWEAFDDGWQELHETDAEFEVQPHADLGAIDQAEDFGGATTPDITSLLMWCVQRLGELREQVSELQEKARVLQKENDLLNGSRAYLLRRLNQVEHLAIAKFTPNYPQAFH